MTASTVAASEVVAHPRILERREAVEDERLRVRQRRYAFLGLLALLGLIGWGLTQSPLLDVNEVRIIGASTTSPHAMRAVAGIEPGTPLLGLDLAQAEQRLLALPAVESVSSERSWNGMVTIDVVERDAVARIATPTGVAIVAADGMVLELTDEPDPALIEISGAMFETTVGSSLPIELQESLTIAAALPSDIATVTERIEMSIDNIELRLTGGGSIALGDARQLDAKFGTTRAFLAQVDLRCLESIDVQAPLVPVLQRAAGC